MTRRTLPLLLGLIAFLVLIRMGVEWRVAAARQGRLGEALVTAVSAGDLVRAKRLLDQGASANTGTVRGPVLVWALTNQDVRMTRLLLERGADPNASDEEHSPLLYVAVGTGHADLVRLLLERGADVNKETFFGNERPLSAAERSGDRQIIEMLKRAGARK